MEISQLEAFVAVAREGSFTLAAERQDITQPSLSARIRRLELSLNGRLIDRRSRPVRLTSLGEVFLPYAERSLAILATAMEHVQAERLELSGQLTIGCPFSVATYLMPDVVDRFIQSFPQAELYIETGPSDYVVSQLADGLVNLALAAAFPKFRQQTATVLRLHDEMTVAVSPLHQLASGRDVPLSEIWSYRQLLIHWGQSFHSYIESLRQMSQGTGPLIRLPLASALPMARQPDTITFMPRRLVAASGLAEVQVLDFSFDWDVVLMTRPGRSLTHLEKEFVGIVSDVWQSSAPLP